VKAQNEKELLEVVEESEEEEYQFLFSRWEDSSYQSFKKRRQLP
jgi:hypothetical protein